MGPGRGPPGKKPGPGRGKSGADWGKRGKYEGSHEGWDHVRPFYLLREICGRGTTVPSFSNQRPNDSKARMAGLPLPQLNCARPRLTLGPGYGAGRYAVDLFTVRPRRVRGLSTSDPA